MYICIVVYWFVKVDVLPGDQEMPYDSEASNETNETNFNFPIPVDETSEPITQDHHDASTPHQLIIMYVYAEFSVCNNAVAVKAWMMYVYSPDF